MTARVAAAAETGPSASAVALMLGSASSIAASGFFALLGMAEVETSTALASRFVLPFATVLVVRLLSGRTVRLERGELGLTALRAAALVASQLCLYVAMLRTSLAEATVLYSTAPLFITLWSCLRGRAPPAVQMIGLAVAAAGVGIMLHVERGTLNTAALIGLAAGGFQAVSQLTLHAASRRRDPGQVMFEVYAIGMVISVALLPLLHRGGLPAPAGLTWLWLGLAALGSMANQYLRSMAYARVRDASSLAPLIYASIPLATILEIAALGRQPDANAWLGGGMVVVGLLLPFARRLHRALPRHRGLLRDADA